MLRIAFHTIMGGCSPPKIMMLVVLIVTKEHGGMATVMPLTLMVFIHQRIMVKVLSGTTGKVITIPYNLQR